MTAAFYTDPGTLHRYAVTTWGELSRGDVYRDGFGMHRTVTRVDGETVYSTGYGGVDGSETHADDAETLRYVDGPGPRSIPR